MICTIKFLHSNERGDKSGFCTLWGGARREWKKVKLNVWWGDHVLLE